MDLITTHLCQIRLSGLSVGPLFIKSDKGTALNHITINGVDKLLSNGSTEVGLNGVNIIEETVLVHGDILRAIFKQLDRISLTYTPYIPVLVCRRRYLEFCPLAGWHRAINSLENYQKSTKLQAYLS